MFPSQSCKGSWWLTIYLVHVDIFGKLYKQCQDIISLKDSGWYWQIGPDGLGRYGLDLMKDVSLNTYDFTKITSCIICILFLLQDYFLYYQMCDWDW